MARKKGAAPVVIYRSVDGDGVTYAVAAESRERIRQAFPGEAHFPPRLFIAHETRDDYVRLHGSMHRQIVMLLTGIDEARLTEAVGPLRFIDPVTDHEVSSPPAHR